MAHGEYPGYRPNEQENKDNVIQFPERGEQFRKDQEELREVWESYQLAPEHLGILSFENASQKKEWLKEKLQKTSLWAWKERKQLREEMESLSRKRGLINSTEERFQTVGRRYYKKYEGQLPGNPSEAEFMADPISYLDNKDNEDSEQKSISQAA